MTTAKPRRACQCCGNVVHHDLIDWGTGPGGGICDACRVARAPIPTLTLWPEWLPTFRYMGKRAENRGWPAPKKLIGKRLALHAGRSIGGGSRRRGAAWLFDAGFEVGYLIRLGRDHLVWHKMGAGQVETRTPIVTGAVVAIATLDRCVQDSGLRWATPNSWHWVLRDFEWLDQPVPAKGRQGLWQWTRPLAEVS